MGNDQEDYKNWLKAKIADGFGFVWGCLKRTAQYAASAGREFYAYAVGEWRFWHLTRIVVTILWAGLVVIGVFAILRREQKRKLESIRVKPAPIACEYSALRDFPLGFRLSDGDWLGPLDKAMSISGRYTARHYVIAERICRSDLLQTAYANPAPGFAAVLVKWPANGLNSGGLVDIWQEQKAIARNARILAVVCPQECTGVMVEVPEADVPQVDPAKVQLTLRKLP